MIKYMLSQNIKKKIWLIIKVTLSLALLVFAFGKVNLDSNTYSQLFKFKYLFAGFLIIILSLVIQNLLHSLRLNLSAQIHNVELNFFDSFRITHIAGFVGFTPAGIIGYELMRINFLRTFTTYKNSISIIYLDRIVGLLAIAFVTLFSCSIILKNTFHFGEFLFRFSLHYIFGFLLFTYIVFSIIISKSFINSINNQKIKFFLNEIKFFLNANKIIDLKLISVSVVMAIIVPIALTLCSSFFLFETSISMIFVISLLGILVSIIPITVGGVGLRESAFIYIANFFNQSSHELFILSILLSISIFIAYSPGFIFLLEGNRKKRI